MFKEVVNDKVKVKAPRMICDDVIDENIPEPLDKKSFIYIIVGAKGSGKTSLMTSLITGKSKPFKVYRGKFDDVLINMPESSARSMAGNPFKSIPRANMIADFNEQLLQTIYEKAEEHAAEEEFTLAILDDASSKLKTNKSMIDGLTQLVHRHRHLRLSLMILVQDLVSVPLGIRKNADALFYFRPTNDKSNQIFREEFLAGFSKDETNKLMDWTFRKKGDFLMVKLNRLPFEYYRNFNLINITHS
tara:strand:+ start:444 stop:1181 length:738 start_codon:yes stop_codon:yes gene_type:complete